MNDITILQLSDLHIRADHLNDIEIVIEALLNDIVSFKKKGINIDYISFCGDLICDGDKGYSKTERQYDLAQKYFIKPLLTCVKLPKTKFLFVPGNHDIERTKIKSNEIFEIGLRDKLKNRDETNKIIDSLGKQPLILDRLSNFNNFKKIFLNKNRQVITKSPLFSSHKFPGDQYSVGFACLNSAWRAYGGSEDYSNLLIGERQVDLAIKDIKDCDLKVAIIHHPLEYLMQFEQSDMKNSLHKNFDMILTGHIHQNDSIRTQRTMGFLITNTCGSLFSGRCFNHYSIIRYDFSKRSCLIIFRKYYDGRREFDKDLFQFPDGKVEFINESQDKIKLHKQNYTVINKSYVDVESELNLSLIPNVTDSQAPKRLIDLFVNPLIADVSEFASQGIEQDSYEYYDLDNLIEENDNYVFFGRKEIGKSTLLKYVCLKYFDNLETKFDFNLRIPILIDFNSLSKGIYPIHKNIGSFLASHKKSFDIESNLKSGNFIFLIDDVIPEKVKELEKLSKFIHLYPSNRYIITVDESLLDIFDFDNLPELYLDFNKLYIHSFTRKEVRIFAKKWFKVHKKDESIILDNIQDNINRINIPVTPMNLSLLFWIFEKNENYSPINEAALLEKFIELILERLKLSDVRSSEFDYRDRVDFLMHLTHPLVRKNKFQISIEKLESFTSNYFKQRGLKVRVTSFLEPFFQKGILIDKDGIVQFRFKCFLEYFIALNVRKNKSCYDHVLNPMNYLSFFNEIVLYTGIARDDKVLLELLIKRTKESFKDICKKVAIRKIDQYTLPVSYFGGLSSNDIEDLMSFDISDDMKDKLLDKTANQYTIQDQTVVKEKYEDYKRYSLMNLLLLASTIRNSELIDDAPLKIKAEKLCIKYFGIIIVYIFNGFDEILKQTEGNNQEDHDRIVYNFRILFAIVINAYIHHYLGTEKLELIIKSVLEKEKGDVMKWLNIMLYFDLGLPGHLDYIMTFFKNCESLLLLEISFLKLMHYYYFTELEKDRKVKVEKILSEIQVKLKYSSYSKINKGKMKSDFIIHLQREKLRKKINLRASNKNLWNPTNKNIWVDDANKS